MTSSIDGSSNELGAQCGRPRTTWCITLIKATGLTIPGE
jgi:hypothetical protein